MPARGLLRPIAPTLAALLAAAATPAAAQQVRLTKLNDVAFGAISSLSGDSRNAQNVCAFSNTLTRGYSIRATGSGTGGAFQLSAGTSTMAYEVQWNALGGQTSGSALSPGVPLTGLITLATSQNCSGGTPNHASLILLIRNSSLGQTIGGVAYSGTLTLMMAPE